MSYHVAIIWYCWPHFDAGKIEFDESLSMSFFIYINGFRFGVTPGHVILYGQSIGTAATVDFAAKNPNIGGVVLHAPLASGKFDVFDLPDLACCSLLFFQDNLFKFIH